MRKIYLVLFIALLSVLLVTACSNDSNNNELSGKTFKLGMHDPNKDIDNPSSYKPIMILDFLDDNIVTNTKGNEEGTYELNKDTLVINFENENEELKIEFADFNDSDKEFSAYSTSISDIEFKIEDNEHVSYLEKLYIDISKDTPIEFIEK